MTISINFILGNKTEKISQSWKMKNYGKRKISANLNLSERQQKKLLQLINEIFKKKHSDEEKNLLEIFLFLSTQLFPLEWLSQEILI